MPPLIAAALVGLGAYAALRAAQRAVAAWSESHPAATPATAASEVIEKDLGTLECDPATGVYRPTKPIS